MQQFLNEVFREVNIFQNDIPLFLNRFVSPMSTMGPNFYKYYFAVTRWRSPGQKCGFGFRPFTPETFGFTGHLFITLDSTYFVQKVKLNVPEEDQLEFCRWNDDRADFRPCPRMGTRIITKDDINVDFKLTEKSKGMYARRLNIYSNQAFEGPDDPKVFEESAPIIIPMEA